MIQLKVVQGRSDMLLLFDGMAGIPESEVPDGVADSNEVCRFELGDAQLARRVPMVAELSARADRLAGLLARCIPFVEGGCDGEEWDDMANDLMDEINAAIEEAVA